MKKFGWYIIAALMTVVFLVGAVFCMIGMALDWIGDQIMKLCHEVERRYWNYEADGYKYCGDGIYTKTYKPTINGWKETIDEDDRRRENLKAYINKIQSELEAAPNMLTGPAVEIPDLVNCPQCTGSRVLGEIRGVRCTKCEGVGYISEDKLPAGKAEPQWSTEHLGPNCQ